MNGKGFKDTVVKRSGRTKLVRRDYRDKLGTSRFFIEEPGGKRGKPSLVKHTFFSGLEGAHRAFHALMRTTGDLGLTRTASSWDLGRDRGERRTTRGNDQSWRLR